VYGRLSVTAEVMVGRTEHLITVGGAAVAPPSDASWGPAGPPLAAAEDAPLRTDPEGGRFHLRMFQAEQSVLEHHRAGHYKTTHLRYPMLYGPRSPGSSDWCIVRRILDGRRRLIVADGGTQLESRAYAGNAAHAVLLAVDQPQTSAGQIYNVADERPLTMLQRVDLIAKALNHQWELVSMPWDLARSFHPVCRSRDHRVLDITKIRTELGYRDVVPVHEALPMAARWLVENRPEPGGELEMQLGDPFDYAAEDAMIDGYLRLKETVLAVPFPDYTYIHPYRHPRQPNETWKRPERPFG